MEKLVTMNTLRITVDNRKNAELLTKLLKSMTFVKKVEEDILVPQEKDQFAYSITQLKGLGKNIWQKTEVEAYIDTERESWD
jgi:hypothetical protein